VAQRFRLAGKGLLAEGAEADLVLLSTRTASTIRAEDLLYRHRQSPYVGRSARVVVRETWARGETVSGKNRSSLRNPARILRPTPL
jgi:allantoinase